LVQHRRGDAPKTTDEYIGNFDAEMKRRVYVRDGNNDYAGQLIDRNVGPPIVPERLRRVGGDDRWLRG
jgi:hypothetical protein